MKPLLEASRKILEDSLVGANPHVEAEGFKEAHVGVSAGMYAVDKLGLILAASWHLDLPKGHVATRRTLPWIKGVIQATSTIRPGLT